MKKSFKIGQSNEIVVGDMVYDLHNCYDVAGVSMSGDGVFCMRFQPNPEWGMNCRAIAIEFARVDYLTFRIDPHSEETADLQEMGYKNPNDEDDSWLLSEDQSVPDDHLCLRFDGDNFVRIHSKEAALIEQGGEDSR